MLIIGDIDFTEIVMALYSAQTSLGREINPEVYSREQWKTCLQKQDFFIQEVLNNSKLFVIGAEYDLG